MSAAALWTGLARTAHETRSTCSEQRCNRIRMLLFRVILESMCCHCQPSWCCCCCWSLVVVVRLCACSFVHYFMCLCVVGTVCCAVVSLRRCVLCVVACRYLFVSDVNFLDLLKKRNTAKAFANDVFIDQQRRRPTTIRYRCSFYHKAADLWLESLASWFFQHIMRTKWLGFGRSMVARLKLWKASPEGHHQEWSLRLHFTQHGKTRQVQT